MITRLELTNFSVFKHLAIDFSPKINVIIGENGTGKTQLMKAAYALCGGNSAIEGRSKRSKTKLEDALASKLIRLFMPLDSKLGSLRRRGASEDAKLEAHFALGEKLSVGFSNKSERSVQILENVNYEQYSQEPIFIPTKELLSLIRGMSDPKSDQETLQRVFDDTYLDLYNLLLRNSTVVNEDRLDFDPRFGSIFPDIVNAIGGKYRFSRRRIGFEEGKYQEIKVGNQDDEYVENQDDDEYVESQDNDDNDKTGTIVSDKTETVFAPIKGSEVSNNMTAEGFRKIGTLQQLLANKSLSPGISGSLFWDEPECNMNPKLIRLLVEILLELSRNGQQIILATHDYVLLKWFDLLIDRKKEDFVSFHSLYRDPKSGEIGIESAESYQQLNANAIASTFSDLYDSEIERALGGTSK